jgi:hypothetical protein
MVAPFNPNDAEVVSAYLDLRAPRHLGRGQALDNLGALTTVDWLAGFVRVGGAPFFALAEAPAVLDISFDPNNRPIVVYKVMAGGFIYYYSPLGAGGYVSEPVGAGESIAVHNDFMLRGASIICVQLVAGEVRFRLHAERWANEYTLSAQKLQAITHFGLSVPVAGQRRNTLIVKGPALS